MHSDLIAKLEALDGPSRAIDALIATTVGGYVYEKRGSDQKAWYYPSDGGWRRKLYSSYADKLPAYTASLDAAIALVERVLPEHARETSAWPGSCHVTILMTDENGFHNSSMGSFEAMHEIEAITLLIALLKALEARDG